MTLFFSLANLEAQSLGSTDRLVWYLRKFWKKELPSLRDKYPPLKKSLSGTSFILNPADLFKETAQDVAYLAQYIRLAARRDYLMYKEYGTTSLPLSFFPELDIRSISHNPLLHITGNRVLFKHERNKHGNRI